jgi:aspartate aminotransferase
MLATCNPGDEVIILSPYWTSYPEQVKMAGATPVFLQASEQNDYKITAGQFRETITPKTRLLIFNSPCNPTGAVYTKEEMAEIADIVAKTGIYVLCDEIYLGLIYDGIEPVSMVGFSNIREQVLLVNGFSKSHAMTGWRVGYLAAEQTIVKAAAKIQSHSTSNISSISQHAAIAAFSVDDTEIEKMRATFAERRNYVVGRLNSMKGFSVRLPKGTFYVYPNVRNFLSKSYKETRVNTSMELTTYLLEQAGVAVVPGEAFGSTENIRLSCANSMQNLVKAMDRIEAALRLLA